MMNEMILVDVDTNNELLYLSLEYCQILNVGDEIRYNDHVCKVIKRMFDFNKYIVYLFVE